MTFPIDFTSQEYLRNPAVRLAHLRKAGPLVEVTFPIVGCAWVTTTEEVASRVLKDDQAFALRRNGATAGTRWWTPRTFRALSSNLLTTDEPDHTRLRRVVDEVFRRRAIVEMEPRICALAEELANDLFDAGSPADLVDRYARALPLAVICELLGLPAADRPRFMTWADNIAGMGTGLRFMWRAYRNIRAIKRYLERQLAAARQTGGDGLIAELIQAEKEGASISSNEIVAMIFLLLFAGNETVTHLISGSAYELLRKPELRDWLNEDWARTDLAVEEFLRFVSPVLFAKPRFAQHDLELYGVHLRQGDMVMPLIAAANFDPIANSNPNQLDLNRKPNRHISFGTGVHFCLGHQLARIECKCALKALFQRWPTLSMVNDPSKVEWRPQPNLRAIEKLLVVR
jgi:cytochrome P450 PksS